MHEVTSATNATEKDVNSSARLKGYVYAFLFLIATIAFYGLLFNKDISLSHSIGYNLYGAERILAGETPYRDFHTLYPPAVVYINAWIFELLGISLYNALLGVFVFKALTAFVLYLCGRLIMPRRWAFLAVAFSLVWLRPNGPFKAVPMHYGALFLALALLFTLKYLRENKSVYLILTGASLGLLALFKHNIGAYALIGLLAAIVFDTPFLQFDLAQVRRNYKHALLIISGLVLALLPVLLFIAAKGALAPMIRTLLFGPGDFLLNRLAGTPSPGGVILFALAMALPVYMFIKFRESDRARPPLFNLMILTAIFFALFGPAWIFDSLVFYFPVAIILTGMCVYIWSSSVDTDIRQMLLAVSAVAAAAFMESFPRFAREQAIGAMPFVILLLAYIVYVVGALAKKEHFKQIRAWDLSIALLCLMFFMGMRLFIPTYLDNYQKLRSNTELTIERGRRVYFPPDKAAEINNVVNYIQERVPASGYIFAQSYTGSSYLFLADRNNPSGAQFWGGVGVTDEERRETLRAIEEKQVALIVTSRKDIEAEKYEPMRQLIRENFEQSREFGDVVILERRAR